MLAKHHWLTGIGRAVATGLAWSVAWAPIGVLIGFIVDPDGSMDEPWLLVGLYPGFLCGVVFSAVAGIAKGRRTLDALSFSEASSRGMMSGLLVAGAWLVLALVSDPPRWLLYALVVGSLTVLSAVSGAGTAWLAGKRAMAR